MAKIYLSSAAHANDNPTKCPMPCGENVHCGQYMDIVERRLRALGFAVKRGDAALTGSAAMFARVSEANAWGADIYYVAHTNAGGGRYSLTLCYADQKSTALANILHKYRKSVAAHRVQARSDLYEIKMTAMPCLYDELFFHDNAEDCTWFHAKGMTALAEETVQALCEITKTAYRPPASPPAGTETAYTVRAGDTLYGIAARYGTTYQLLAQHNGIADPGRIRTGQRLRIPGTAPPDLNAAARDVIAGKYGNGAERRQRLAAAGYDPDAVQARVNILSK